MLTKYYLTLIFVASISVGQVGGCNEQTFGRGKFTGRFALPCRGCRDEIGYNKKTSTKQLTPQNITTHLVLLVLRWYTIESQ